MIFEIISGGEKTDWVGKEWAGLFFPRGKNGPAHSFPGEKTDWGEIPACYTGSRGCCLNTRPIGRVLNIIRGTRQVLMQWNKHVWSLFLHILPYSSPIRTENAAKTLNCPFLTLDFSKQNGVGCVLSNVITSS